MRISYDVSIENLDGDIDEKIEIWFGDTIVFSFNKEELDEFTTEFNDTIKEALKNYKKKMKKLCRF